jgi:lipid II:glycine glycyltransferase (peptidoglycan interpeptide bridge formation enzyme)
MTSFLFLWYNLDMTLIKLDNLNSLEKIDYLANGEFLQSLFWGEILAKDGEIVERWGVEESGQIRASIIIIKKSLGRGFFYWYGPRGPIGDKEAIEFLLLELKKEKKSAVFLRIEPLENLTAKSIKVSLKKSIDLQPKKTLLLDLSLNEDDLLKAMHQKTRYNIKLAEKKGVKISEGGDQDFKEFWRLMSLTSERDGFRLHGERHYKNLLSAKKNIRLFLASYEGKIIAAGLFCLYGARVTYLHGASNNEARNLMAPYLLQWEIIKKARAEGYNYYDFYGIDDKKWPGVTRFKNGFGGFAKEYPGTYDFVFKPIIYGLYQFLRKIKRSL